MARENPYTLDTTRADETTDVTPEFYNQLVENIRYLVYGFDLELRARQRVAPETYTEKGSVHLNGIPAPRTITAGQSCIWWEQFGIGGSRQVDMERRESRKFRCANFFPKPTVSIRPRSRTVIEGQRFVTAQPATERAKLGGCFFPHGVCYSGKFFPIHNFPGSVNRQMDDFSYKETAIAEGDIVWLQTSLGNAFLLVAKPAGAPPADPVVKYNSNTGALEYFYISESISFSLANSDTEFCQVMRGPITFRDCIFEMPVVVPLSVVTFEFCHFLKYGAKGTETDPLYRNGRIDGLFATGIPNSVDFQKADGWQNMLRIFCCSFLLLNDTVDEEPSFLIVPPSGWGITFINNVWLSMNPLTVDEIAGYHRCFGDFTTRIYQTLRLGQARYNQFVELDIRGQLPPPLTPGDFNWQTWIWQAQQGYGNLVVLDGVHAAFG